MKSLCEYHWILTYSSSYRDRYKGSIGFYAYLWGNYLFPRASIGPYWLWHLRVINLSSLFLTIT